MQVSMQVHNCIERCPTCPSWHTPIMGDGPEPSNILIIGDRPGEDSVKRRLPAQGKWSKEFNDNYLWKAGLRREDVRITETIKCCSVNGKKTTDIETESCSHRFLPGEIEDCSPTVIILLGSTACSRAIPEIDLDIEHGIPRLGAIHGSDWEGIIVPMYHPALGLRDTSKMTPLLEDFERLGEFLEGKWALPDDPYPSPDYRLIENRTQLREYLRLGKSKIKLLGMDTERHGSHPFSYQFSHTPGTGRMVLCDRNPELAGDMSAWAEETKAELVLHNAGQDLDWLDRMGIKVNRFRDTMQEAYHLGHLPQGLKALAYRTLGVRMRTYVDVVMPYSRKAVQEWIFDAMDYAGEHLVYVSQKQLKTKVKEIRKPSEIERGLNRIVSHSILSDDYDTWKKMEELFANPKLTAPERQFVDSTRNQDIAGRVIGRLTGNPGAYPIAGIGNVPLDEAVMYGCSDADMTLRVELELQKIRAKLTGERGAWDVTEDDEDK
jgi:uracil-DNA glycosylase family 4